MFWGRLASFLAGIPVRIIPCHSTGKYGGKKNFNRLDHLLMGMTDVIVAISKTHAKYLREEEGIEARKIEVIENGIDIGRLTHIDTVRVSALKRELGIGDDEKVVIMVAALRPEKAHEVLLDAAQRLVGKGSNVRFLIVGGGSRQAMLEMMADEMGLGESVHFLGRRDDVPELLHLSDVMVLPSHGVVETLPLSVLEAMAAGVPVVATAVGSLPEMITDGENGKLIPTGNPDALAVAIESIVTDEEAARSMAEVARERVADRYSVERMVVGYAALFEEALRAKNACP
jgi:glycosyltransferase involved in cell wall biosynthesis